MCGHYGGSFSHVKTTRICIIYSHCLGSSQVYADQDEWTRRSILYTAGSGKFSSDRTIYEYAKDIWDVKPVPVPSS